MAISDQLEWILESIYCLIVSSKLLVLTLGKLELWALLMMQILDYMEIGIFVLHVVEFPPKYFC